MDPFRSYRICNGISCIPHARAYAAIYNIAQYLNIWIYDNHISVWLYCLPRFQPLTIISRDLWHIQSCHGCDDRDGCWRREADRKWIRKFDGGGVQFPGFLTSGRGPINRLDYRYSIIMLLCATDSDSRILFIIAVVIAYTMSVLIELVN